MTEVFSAPAGVYVERSFEELTVHELYALLRLRSEVFVVEQNCVYPDLDGKDQISRHLFFQRDGAPLAYCRWYCSAGDVVLGRIVTSSAGRGLGLGRALMEEALRRIDGQQVRLSAQAHLQDFYRQFGFRSQGELYDDAGIPHVTMVRAALEQEQPATS